MNNLGDSNLKEKYLLGLKTAGFFLLRSKRHAG